jgi:hypothetical protein
MTNLDRIDFSTIADKLNDICYIDDSDESDTPLPVFPAAR